MYVKKFILKDRIEAYQITNSFMIEVLNVFTKIEFVIKYNTQVFDLFGPIYQINIKVDVSINDRSSFCKKYCFRFAEI